MSRDKVAQELADLGRDEARLMRKLIKLQKRRCELLSEVACHADTGLSPDVAAAAAGPKNPPPND